MKPTQLEYPEFVPDQLLTTASLNALFGYLDEQQRMTRTNLLGIGIACGLHVEPAADGSTLTVTGGAAVTSQGYLAAVEATTYHQYIPFDATQAVHYAPFLTSSLTPRLQLWELKREAAVPGAQPLTQAFLSGGGGDSNDRKVVLLFVELLRVENAECTPESCDDRGITIEVQVRALLARAQDVESCQLDRGIGAPLFPGASPTLPTLVMPRFDAPASTLVSSLQLMRAYAKLLSEARLQTVQLSLSQAWQQFAALLGPGYQTDPFSGFASALAYAHNDSITTAQVRGLQYIYDHVSDVVAAYNEFRSVGLEALRLCCPDAELFPRHVLLDQAIPNPLASHARYRHRFQPSPLFSRTDLLGRLRSLFRRLVLIVKGFAVPAPVGESFNPDERIRITPSRLAPAALSDKAIPYYYTPAAPAAAPLFKSWSYERAESLEADTVLSYHARDYSLRSEVLDPLAYDLEPYNFLRVEGHIGKSYSHVLSTLQRLVRRYRLPIEVVALKLSDDPSGIARAELGQLNQLYLQYEILSAELQCCLRSENKYWKELPVRERAVGRSRQFNADALERQVAAIVSTGEQLEKWLAAQSAASVDFDELERRGEALEEAMTGLSAVVESERKRGRAISQVRAVTGASERATVDAVEQAMPGFGGDDAKLLISYMQSAPAAEHAKLANGLALLQAEPAKQRVFLQNAALQAAPTTLRVSPVEYAVAVPEDGFVLELDQRLRIGRCRCGLAALRKLQMAAAELIARLRSLALFPSFIEQHPGINHKAGVPLGGTFILAYHATAGSGNDANSDRYAAAVNGLAQGEVVADFYLPYLIASHIDAVQFQVTDAEPPPAQVTLTLQPNATTGAFSYSVADTTSYRFAHTPDGGALEGGSPDNGVTSPRPDVFVFTPAATRERLRPVDELALKFQYIKAGVRSAEVNVTVLKQPDVKPGVEGPSTRIPARAPFTVRANAVRADVFSWSMVAAAGGGAVPLRNERDLTSFALDTPGSYELRVHAVQSATGASAEGSVLVEIVADPQTAIECSTLSDWLKLYKTLPELDPQNYPEFERSVLKRLGISEYFEKLQSLESQPENDQLAFLNETLDELLDSRLPALVARIRDGGSERERALELRLYRILLGLLQMVVCKNDGPVSDRRKELLSRVVTHIQSPSDGFSSRQLTKLELAQLRVLRSDIEGEHERETKRAKPREEFVSVLKVLVQVLEPFVRA